MMLSISRFKELDHKKLFIYGSYIAILSLGLFGTLVDTFIHSSDAYIDFLYVLFTFIAFRHCKKENNIIKAGLSLFWISAFSEFAFLYMNNVDFDLIFAILIPIIAFVSLPLKYIIINLVLFYFLLISILIYYYIQYPLHPFLHNYKYMFAYFIANSFMIIYGFFYHFAIVESIRRLEDSNKQNAILLREVHHRVKNNLNLMASILALQGRENNNSIVKQALSESRSRIESMAVLHEVLYKNNPSNYLDLKKYIEQLISHIIRIESSHSKVDIVTKVDSIVLDINNLIQLGIMLNELVTNSLKHSTNKKGIVKIDIKFIKNQDKYYLIYCDNSTNVSLEKLHKGFGYKLINLAIRQLRGKLSLDTSNGLCYQVEFSDLEEPA